jgi:hypothetical protein
VRVEVTARSITTDDQVQITTTAEGSYDELVPPDVSQWNITGTYQSTQLSFVMGRRSEQRQVVQTLVPKQAGTLQIGPAQLRRGGQVVATSEAISIVVSPAAQAAPVTPGQLGDPSARAGDAAFIHPIFPAGPIYEGQPFVLAYELYIRANLNASDRGVTSQPSYNDFAVFDLLSNGRPPQQRKRVANQMFNVIVLQRNLLVPLKAGKIQLEAMEMALAIGDMFSQRRFVAKSPPVTIDVLPIPTEGRPASFRDGAIGQFTLEAAAQPTSAAVGERILVTVTVKGRGNLGAIKPLSFPQARELTAELLPSGDKPGVLKDASGIHGEASFSYIVTAKRAGKTEIPAFRLGFFDPATQKFGEAASQPIALDIAGDTESAAATSGRDSGGLVPIVAEVSLTRQSRDSGVGGPLFWALLGLPLMGFLGVELRALRERRNTANAPKTRVREAGSNAKRVLKGAESLMHPGKEAEFFQAISAALTKLVADRFGVTATGATREELRAALLAQGVGADACGALLAELDNCDFARFAPAQLRLEEMQGSLERARKIVDALDAASAARSGKRA